jgi:mono/diheme cytochrome c family protein
MTSTRIRLAGALLCLVAAAANAKLTPEQLAQLPAPSGHPIDFKKHIQPIFEDSCVKCHGRGRAKGDFQIDSRESLLKGGESGPAVLAGNSAESLLIELVMGFDPDTVMPQKGSKLTAEQIGLLRAWIDQGAKWDSEVTFGKREPLNLIPRRPELPASRSISTNPIDRLLNPYVARHQIKPPRPVDDRVFARRV